MTRYLTELNYLTSPLPPARYPISPFRMEQMGELRCAFMFSWLMIRISKDNVSLACFVFLLSEDLLWLLSSAACRLCAAVNPSGLWYVTATCSTSRWEEMALLSALSEPDPPRIMKYHHPRSLWEICWLGLRSLSQGHVNQKYTCLGLPSWTRPIAFEHFGLRKHIPFHCACRGALTHWKQNFCSWPRALVLESALLSARMGCWWRLLSPIRRRGLGFVLMEQPHSLGIVYTG